jgi:predicted secreted protein
MVKPLGRAFKLQYENPASPGAYITLANCKDNSQGLSNEQIDTTDKDGAPDRELLEGGIRSTELSASGIFSDAASIKLMKQWTRAGNIKNFRTIDGLGNMQTGPFLCVSFDHAGSYDGEQTWDFKLSSAGVMTYIDV